MDTMILMISLLFMGIVGVGVFMLFYKEPPKTPRSPLAKEIAPEKNDEPHLIAQLQKKIAFFEEEKKEFQLKYEAAQLELTKIREHEKSLLKEKTSNAFDAEQYEKFKKEYHTLKEELIKKEEILEKEIASRRQQASELSLVKEEADALKKRVSESEDASRKAQVKIETLTEELNLAKKTIEEQKKIVQEHSINKKEGEWVSREEFARLERQLQEKDALLKQFLKK